MKDEEHSPGKKAAYPLADFQKACCEQKRVVVGRRVTQDARRVFGLSGAGQIMELICNELGYTWLQNSKPFQKKGAQGELVDAYLFTTENFRKGYLAFYLDPNTDNWVIKSFHEADDSYFPFRLLKGFKGKQNE